MSGPSRIRRLAGLTRHERAILARALVLLPLAALALRTLGMRRAQALLARQSPLRKQAVEPMRIARLVEVAARRGPVRVKCLPASLTLQSLLTAAGVPSELRLGVRKRGTLLEAHAWVEQDGVALMEPEGVHLRFSAFSGGARR